MDKLQQLKSRHSLERSCQARLMRCPILACQQMTTCYGADDSTGHSHSHPTDDGLTWHNTRLYPDGTFHVTKVDGSSRDTLETVPQAELLQTIPDWWNPDLRPGVEAWLASFLNDTLLDELRQRPKEELAECLGSLTTPEKLQRWFDPPEIRVIDSCGLKFGGVTTKEDEIWVSSFMTVDKNECLVVVVHEIGHVLRHRICGNLKDPHGEEFEGILRFLGGPEWERYKNWQPNNYIEDLRLQLHPGSRRLL